MCRRCGRQQKFCHIFQKFEKMEEDFVHYGCQISENGLY